MLREITLGQYYPADSIIHKLDPRVKLFATLNYVVSLFTFRGLTGLVLVNNPIADVNALTTLTNLEWANLSENTITDISVLATLTKAKASGPS